MRGIRKVLFVMAAMTALVGFVSCKQESNTVVYEDSSGYITLSFYDDGTFKMWNEASDTEVFSGTHDGNPPEDGTFTMEVTSELGHEVHYSTPITFQAEISGDTIKLKQSGMTIYTLSR